MDENTQALPGLANAGHSPNLMAQAAANYIKSLRDAGLIHGHHVLTVQLVLGLADAIGKAAAKGQAAAMAMASKELREAMALLPQPAATDDFQKFLDSLKDNPEMETTP